MEMTSEASGDPVPLMDCGCPLCLSLHLEVVYNLTYGGRHAHRRLTRWKYSTLEAWKALYCATIMPPQVTEINTPPWSDTGATVETTMNTKIRRSRGLCIIQKIHRGNLWHTQVQPAPGPTITEIPEDASPPTGSNWQVGHHFMTTPSQVNIGTEHPKKEIILCSPNICKESVWYGDVGL